MKRYLWYTDLVLSTLGAYLGDLLGDTFNSIVHTQKVMAILSSMLVLIGFS